MIFNKKDNGADDDHGDKHPNDIPPAHMAIGCQFVPINQVPAGYANDEGEYEPLVIRVGEDDHLITVI